jgi:periplasmic protein CpxP/Spy
MFKHSLLVLSLAGLIYAVPALAQSAAPDQSAPNAQQQQWHGRGDMDPAKHTEMLTKKLNLTPDQQTKVQEIFKSEQSQMESMHGDSSVSRDQRHAKMMEIHKASGDQVRALLDPTQQKKWDEMQANREQRMHDHHQGGQMTPPSSDQQ